jgi:hypothetical protein
MCDSSLIYDAALNVKIGANIVVTQYTESYTWGIIILLHILLNLTVLSGTMMGLQRVLNANKMALSTHYLLNS